MPQTQLLHTGQPLLQYSRCQVGASKYSIDVVVAAYLLDSHLEQVQVVCMVLPHLYCLQQQELH
jgi:hypothetical protein